MITELVAADPSSARAENYFLCSLFSALDQWDIDYAVMRNFQTLPFSSGGSDLDILIQYTDKNAVVAAVINAAHDSNATPCGISYAPGFFKIYILGKNLKFEDSWWGLRIDINLGLYFKGLTLLDNNIAIPYTTHNSIKVLPEGLAGILGVLKEVLNNNIIPDRYFEAARTAAQLDWANIEKRLSPMGPKALAALQQSLFKESTDEKAACIAIRKHFYRHVLMSRPRAYFSGRSHSLLSRLLRYFKPSGTVIAVLGTDGAGKSTIIDAIKPALDQATHNATVVRHLRPNFLPPLARLKAGCKEQAGPVTAPHGSSPSGFIGSLLRIAYATLNYILGYWFETRLQIAKQPTIVIFDRYAYDMELDQPRFRISLPKSLVRFFVRLTPKPDLVFCLVGSPQVLAARKHELPVEEVARQVEALKAFSAREPRAVLVNTEQSVDACRDQILGAIVDYCGNKRPV